MQWGHTLWPLLFMSDKASQSQAGAWPSVMSQSALLWLDESCAPSHAVLWCDLAVAEWHYESLLMIYTVCTFVHLCVYFSGLISLVAYFLLQTSVAAISVKPSASESHADICVPVWTVLHWECKMCLFRFNRNCSTLNTEPSSSSSCTPTVLCCRFGARYHMGTFVPLAKRQLLII